MKKLWHNKFLDTETDFHVTNVAGLPDLAMESFEVYSSWARKRAEPFGPNCEIVIIDEDEFIIVSEHSWFSMHCKRMEPRS